MNQVRLFGADAFEDIDISELDLIGVEIVQTSSVMGIPETGASCCYCTCSACSSCCVDPT